MCLQFDVGTEPIAGAFKVSYVSEFPLSIVTEHDDDAAWKALLTKSDVWDYEEEFRLVARDARVPFAGFLLATEGIVPIGDRALVGIIIGCQCEAADEILEMVRQHQPSVTVRQAKRLPHRYGLGFGTLHPGQ